MDKIIFIIIALCSTCVTQAEEVVIPPALLKQVESGDAESAFFIATAFAEGRMGVTADLEQAKQWFLKSAEMGYVHGMYEIGKMLYKEDAFVKAKSWFEKAAEQGHGESYYYLSVYPLYGLDGEPFDCHKAYALLKEAQLRDVKAAYNDHAWMLSTLPDKKCRNGQKAWRIFADLQSLYSDLEPIPWAYLDTKAAVFAEISAFNEAIEVQSWIVEDFCDIDFDADENKFKQSLLELSNESNETVDGLCYGAVRRLQSYVQRKPWREEPEL